ncbi:MAG: PfkB family carbohydrate kinase [Pseudomonadota bacterium]
MRTVLVVGSTVTDFLFEVDAFPDRAEKYAARDGQIVGGGCAGNAAVAIARLGGRAELAARMGQDLIGDLTLGDLEAEGVETGRVLRAEGGRSAFSAIHITPDGERMVTAFRGTGLAETVALDDAEPDAILVDTRWPDAAAVALDRARALGVPGILDGEAPVPLDLARRASHVAFSAQGLRAFTDELDLEMALRQAASRLDTWVAVTDGGAGVFVAAETPVRHPAFPVEVVDTLAAGDVWHGAFALALAEGQGEDAAIRFAAAAAALKCTRAGGRRGAPYRTETERFLGERG